MATSKQQPLDAAYSFKKSTETGRWVTYFNGERIGSGNTKGQAVDTARWHQDRRAQNAKVK